MLKIILIYLAIANLAGLAVMAIDKKRAIKGQWRIPEKTLFLFSLIGGSIGTWAGMYLFRHKTKHWYFVIGMPAILFIQIGLVVFFKLR
ncbi:Uncharacterized membrane protein YsdA, DUF1294 family [Pseudobutyrivibrio sp. YE44]|uniref:DUF1294 domain-containing protein n=1 Tax=Pseudobutyrivibrio sp. YE44 TaxID=1520802 RepID=UPI0008881235|nr:DUF1294 domain-containing protein [Pseudobutyrivibrio sp. YE44]SDB45392.1 Uncharacterized membrane protein YsdA, DUF1294 family [Pseudobutyrivibrio sp. YE44]